MKEEKPHLLKKLSVLIPVFNEASTLSKTVTKVLEADISEMTLEIVIVMG